MNCDEQIVSYMDPRRTINKTPAHYITVSVRVVTAWTMGSPPRKPVKQRVLSWDFLHMWTDLTRGHPTIWAKIGHWFFKYISIDFEIPWYSKLNYTHLYWSDEHYFSGCWQFPTKFEIHKGTLLREFTIIFEIILIVKISQIILFNTELWWISRWHPFCWLYF